MPAAGGGEAFQHDNRDADPPREPARRAPFRLRGRTRQTAAGAATERDMSDLFFPPIVSLSALTFATVLSVAKPWGRLRTRG